MQEKYFLDNEKYDIRFNKRSKHFSIIIGKSKKKFIFLTLTHTLEYRNNQHLSLLYNPNKSDNKISYVDKKIRRSKKQNFEKIRKDYVLKSLDKVLIDLFIIEPYLERKALREAKENKLQHETKNNLEITKEINIEKIIKQNKDKEYAKEIERER